MFARCVEFAVGVNIVQRLARFDPALGTRWPKVAIPLLLLLLFLLLLTVSTSWLHPLTVPSSVLAPTTFTSNGSKPE